MYTTNFEVWLNNIDKYYGKNKVLNQISLKLQSGKVYGLMGENGAGKTTLMKILTGLTTQSAGEKFFSEKISIGALIEETGAYKNMNAKENLKNFSGCLHEENRENIEKLLHMVGLKDSEKIKVKNYSVGMKKRLGIAIALLNKPDLLVLDEPSSGLDIQGIMEIREIVKNFMKEKGKITLISSHDTRDLAELCDEIIFIHKGNLVLQKKEIERNSLELEKVYLKAIERNAECNF